jgi:hypothetical protein
LYCLLRQWARARLNYYKVMDPDIKALIQVLIEGQIRTDKSVNELAVTVDQFVTAADARMKRIEENLDGLIRAITREHSNGKAH